MDPISRRLDEAASGVVPHLAPAVAVRARGEHRRRVVRRAAAAGSAAVIVVLIATGAALAGTSGNERSQNLPLATPTGAAAPSASPTPSASASSSPSPSQQPSPPPLPPVSLPPPGPTDEPPATPAPVTELPDGFTFDEERSREWMLWPEEFEVTRAHDLNTEWALDPCSPTTYPTDRLRTDFYQVRRDGPEHAEVRQVAVYPSEADAYEVMAGFRRVLTACAQRISSDVPRSLTQHDTKGLPLGDDGLLIVTSHFQDSSHFGVPGPGKWLQHPGGGYTAVIRVGNAVYLAADGGEWTPQRPYGDDAGAISVRKAAAQAVDLLCNSHAGCQ